MTATYLRDPFFVDGPGLYFVADSDGVLLAINREWERRFEIDDDLLVGRSLVELVHDRQREALRGALVDVDVPASESSHRVDVIFIEGPLQGRECELSLRFDPRGEVFLGETIERERPGADEMLTEKAFFDALSHNGRDIISVINPDSSMRYVSPTAQNIIGYRPEEILGNPALDRVHPEDTGVVYTALRQIFEAGSLERLVEYRTRHKEGYWVHVESTGALMRRGSDIVCVVITRDISERKAHDAANERNLEQKARRMRRLRGRLEDMEIELAAARDDLERVDELRDDRAQTLQRAGIGFLRLARVDEPAIEVHEIDARAAKLLCIEPGRSLDGVLLTALWPAFRDDAVSTLLEGVFEGGGACYLGILDAPDGEGRVEGVAARLEDGEVGLLIRDASAMQRRVVDVLERYEDLRLEHRRLTRRVSLIADMDYELHSWLCSITGYSELVEEEARERSKNGADDRLLHDLGRIRLVARELQRRIAASLSMARLIEGPGELVMEQFSLMRLLELLGEELRPLLERRGHYLVLRHSGELGRVYADASKLREALGALVLWVTTRSDEEAIFLDIEPPSRGHRRTFLFRMLLDDSPGVSTGDGTDRALEGLVDAALSGDDPGGELVGLLNAELYLRMMGGHLRFVSRGEVVVVEVEIPGYADRLDRAIADTSPPIDTDEFCDESGPVALVVDDQRRVHDTVRDVLGPEGFEVISSYDGQEALRIARERQPDIITLDALLPSLDGWSLLQEIRRDPQLSSVPVIVASNIPDLELGYALGADHCLHKPIDPVEMLHSVRELVERDAESG